LVRFELGELQLTVLEAGSLSLDGGAMFGVVPKPLWERQRSPDEQNRIRLAMNVLLIDDGRTKTLVDSGAGTKTGKKWREIYALESTGADELLAPAGLDADSIDRVVNSHLHFDHAGGNTARSASGQLVPAFPRAEYIFQRDEIETARLDNEKTRAAYEPDDFEPLFSEPGRVRLVEGETILGRGVSMVPVPGHTPGLQMVVVGTREGTLAFPSDLVPTASHVPYNWIMAFDLDPLMTLYSKKRWLPRAAAEGWKLLFEHDENCPLATIEEQHGRLVPRPWRPRD
jgi:glyoxylase-like metal-dependent hydrolase (beta-lactamase superfamily II)